MKDLFNSMAENAIFVLVFAGIILANFLIAYAVEKISKKRSGDTERILTTRKIVVTGMFSAIAVILHICDFGVPFAPPGVYRMDLSEIPVLIGAYAYGPVIGVLIEFIKIILKLMIKGTSTAFVGDLANFLVGCSLVLPASIIYRFKKTKKNAIISCITGTIIITVFGSAFNAFYLIPTFATMYGMPVDAIIGMGTELNAHITDLTTFVLFIVAPFNLLKGAVDSIITILIYKPLHPILKSNK